MEFDIFLGVAALVIAAVLTWCILRFFFAPRRGGARATLHDGVQQATITVRGGYSPDIVTMQAGIPITLRFDRKETGECTSSLVTLRNGNELSLDFGVVEHEGAKVVAIASLIGGVDMTEPVIEVVNPVSGERQELPFVEIYHESELR